MKFLSVIFILLLSLAPCNGHRDYLEPIRDYSCHPAILKDYYVELFSRLYQGLSDRPAARFVAAPAFSAERAFSLETIKGKRYIVSRTFTGGLWYARSEGLKVDLVSDTSQISIILHDRIAELFRIALSSLRMKLNSEWGFDGVTYYFETVDDKRNIIRATKWSPDKGTIPAELVAVCNELLGHSKNPNFSEREMILQINRLIVKIWNRDRL